jgi:hypothetical protein
MYNFVIDCSDEELIEFRQIDSLDQQQDLSTVTKILIGTWVWCLPAYIYLKSRGTLPVMLSNKYDERYINLVHSDVLVKMPGKSSEFIVCVQADFTYRGWAHFHLVQNRNQLVDNSAFVPLWVHPGLLGRATSRTGVHRVAYAGQTFNNNLAGTTDTWQELLSPYGIEFSAIANDAWHDLREVDVLVGVRTFDLQPHDKKPPSKLINAWHARIPFIGGHDSAYKQIGVPEEDYLLVETPKEVVQAIMRLRDDPQLYEKLVRNGTAKALQYTQESIISTWEKLLTGTILQRYEKWKSRRQMEDVRFVVMRIIGLQLHLAKKVVKKVLKAIGRR